MKIIVVVICGMWQHVPCKKMVDDNLPTPDSEETEFSRWIMAKTIKRKAQFNITGSVKNILTWVSFPRGWRQTPQRDESHDRHNTRV